MSARVVFILGVLIIWALDGLGLLLIGWMLLCLVIGGIISIRAPEPCAVVRAWLHHRVCASCGYTLAGIPAQDDGCTVCPECAAAWKLPAEAEA